MMAMLQTPCPFLASPSPHPAAPPHPAAAPTASASLSLLHIHCKKRRPTNLKSISPRPPSLSSSLTVRCHTPESEDSVDRSSCPSVKPEIHPSVFSSTVDLRVGLITHAKPVLDPEMSEKRGKPTNSRRYLQLTVDIGCEIRTIVSECKYVMDVEDAVGKKVLVVANVSPAEVLGIQSHGLVLIGLNYDPTPMPRSFKLILPGLGRLPPGSQVMEATIPN